MSVLSLLVLVALLKMGFDQWKEDGGLFHWMLRWHRRWWKLQLWLAKNKKRTR